jgi:hypothetical protein
LAALALGIALTIGSLPVAWSIVGAIALPMPTLFVFLAVFLERQPPLPLYAAFALSLCYAAAVTVLARTLSDRPGRFLLGMRGAKPPAASESPREEPGGRDQQLVAGTTISGDQGDPSRDSSGHRLR